MNFDFIQFQETDLHTKRTGHIDFVDKTSEVTKPINLETPNTYNSTPMDVDASASASSEGTFSSISSFIYTLFKCSIGPFS